MSSEQGLVKVKLSDNSDLDSPPSLIIVQQNQLSEVEGTCSPHVQDNKNK